MRACACVCVCVCVRACVRVVLVLRSPCAMLSLPTVQTKHSFPHPWVLMSCGHKRTTHIATCHTAGEHTTPLLFAAGSQGGRCWEYATPPPRAPSEVVGLVALLRLPSSGSFARMFSQSLVHLFYVAPWPSKVIHH